MPVDLTVMSYQTIDGYWENDIKRFQDFTRPHVLQSTYQLDQKNPIGPFQNKNESELQKYVHNLISMQFLFSVKSLQIEFLASIPNKWDLNIIYSVEMGTGLAKSSFSVKKKILESPQEIWYILIDSIVLFFASFALYLHMRSWVRLGFYQRELKKKWENIPKSLKEEYTNNEFNWNDLSYRVRYSIVSRTWPVWATFGSIFIIISAVLDLIMHFKKIGISDIRDIFLGLGTFLVCCNL